MLGDYDAIANIAVGDLGVARKFYEESLGLTLIAIEGDEAIVFRSGGTSLIVYRSQYAGTNQATAVTWRVDDIQRTITGLKAKGIVFEHYALPGVRREGEVHIAGEMQMAWFKDPDGNILAINNA